MQKKQVGLQDENGATKWWKKRETRRDVKKPTYYEPIKNWMLSVSQSTRQNYYRYLTMFLEFAKLTPEKLVLEARKDRVAVHYQAKRFNEKMRIEGYASETRGVAYTSIRSFLQWNDVIMGKVPRSFRGRPEFETGRVIEPQEIAAMMHVARNTRDKAVLSFLIQSGQRSGVLTALKYRHVRMQLDSGVNPVVVDIPAELKGRDNRNVNKSRTAYSFAIGKECAALLVLMLEDRRKAGEKLIDESPLFRSYSDVNERLVDERQFPVRRLRADARAPAMTKHAIHQRVIVLADRAGVQRSQPWPRMTDHLGRPAQRHDIHPHAFRRFWKFQMRKGGVNDSALLEFMMGHRNMRLLHGAQYDSYSAEYIRREYSKAEQYLTFVSNIRSNSMTQMVKPPWEAQAKKSKSDGKVIQRVISEWEIDSYLSGGWKYVCTLPSGRIIVEA